jgi:hypothetical protein
LYRSAWDVESFFTSHIEDPMSLLPTRLEDLLTFMDNHATVWDTNHVALGLSTGQSTGFKSAAGAARLNYNLQLTAITAAKSATVKQQSSTADARGQAADCLKTIKAFALTQPDPNVVYALAQIPPPAIPQPAPPPGTPTDFKATLENNGAVTIRWKAANPSGQAGTVWTIKRRTGGGGGGPFTFVGAVGRRAFTDETVPGGSGAVQYIVQGQRAEAVGDPSTPFTVQFGVDGGGLTIAAQFSEPETSGKMAA